MSHPSQPVAAGSSVGAGAPIPEPEKVSDEFDHWLGSDAEKTLGSLIELFGEKSFAILFVLLWGAALPLPTGGATHGFEIIAVLLALELVADAIRFGCQVAGASLNWRAISSSASSRDC